MKRFIVIFILLSAVTYSDEESYLIKMKPSSEIDRAELYIWKPKGELKAAIIFCPGHNNSGETFVNNKEWRTYAVANRIGLVGLSFASPMRLTKEGKGYSHVERESGKILLSSIEKEFGKNDLPLLFYGYSAGARFSTSFLAWKPERVMSWCASGVGTWPDLPVAEDVAPGIVACGEFDAACHWSSLNYFQEGRKKGYSWTWISLAETGHQQSKELDDFVRVYFEHFLSKPNPKLGYIKYDIATNLPMTGSGPQQSEIFSSCLPANGIIAECWLKIHRP